MTETATPRTPMRYRLSRSFNLFLAKKFGVKRVSAIRLARSLNVIAAPFELKRRRDMAQKIIAERRGKAQAIAIDKVQGFQRLNPDALPEVGPAIAEAHKAYRFAVERAALELGHHGTSRKTFMQYAADSEATANYPAIMKLAVARPVLDAVTEYLGEVPIVGNASILVSMPNDSEVGSQLYHLDFADEKQVKLFVYVDEVTADNGPFTFTPIPVTEELVKTYDYDRGRLTIDQVRKAVGGDKEIQVTGPAGSALLCDTSRCLHYGSNRNKTDRVVILIQYVSHAVPEQPPVVWPAARLARELNLDSVQRMALEL
ncbi:MAG: hypothetical protein HY245_02075 [Rhizobiales bacterium]|nr:hypothetical protein [Hyphomicrobiales bacterium]MBI3672216.1 hypothetical protein [Hyphomicrobiales bacterium]